jgi:hypothetical protein
LQIILFDVLGMHGPATVQPDCITAMLLCATLNNGAVHAIIKQDRVTPHACCRVYAGHIRDASAVSYSPSLVNDKAFVMSR